jgi:hypothetical protein
VAEDLPGEFSLRPLLERILRRCTELLGCHAGSICSVDEAAGTYRKEADIRGGVSVGPGLPAHRGNDRSRGGAPRSGVVRCYDEVRGGHVAAEERATLRGVIGVPLEWRGRVIGACIVFSRDERRVFGPDEQAGPRLRVLIAAARPLLRAGIVRLLSGTELGIGDEKLVASAHEQLAQRGINVRRNYVGNYCTSLDMAGTSITLSRLDDEIRELLAAPAEIAIRTF